jgi:hypothetical protein
METGMNWIVITLIAVAILIVVFAWGYFRIKRRVQDAYATLSHVEQSRIPVLVEECIRICRDKLGATLELKDLEGSANVLDQLLSRSLASRSKTAFETPDHPGHFVLPFGAFIGELVRTHNPGARWVPRKAGGLAMDVPSGSSTLTIHPFDKVLKHAATGPDGDLASYIRIAAGKQQLTAGDRVVETKDTK